MKKLFSLLVILSSLFCSITVFSQNNTEIKYWRNQLQKALEERGEPTGLGVVGVKIPDELTSTDGLDIQKIKLAEMIKQGYKMPLDFADLAEKKLSGELVALPMATENYVLDVGGSATSQKFTQFSFATGSKPLNMTSPKFKSLSKLAEDFDGLKYDIKTPTGRKSLKINLLRMVNPSAKAILEEITLAYKNEFGRPLRVTSAVRSIEYQVALNTSNANSFKVSGTNPLVSHSSGCAFDLSYKQMTAKEQNFLMAKIADLENKGLIEGILEGGEIPVLHIFVYADGKPPKK